MRLLLSPNNRSQLLNFPCLRGRTTESYVFECASVFTRPHCAAGKTRYGEKKKAEGGVTTMAWGLSLFVHKNGVCVGPGPPSLILYQLTPTPHPHTLSRTQQRRKLTRVRHFSFFFLLFFPFAVTRFIAFLSAERCLNYRFEVP